MGISQSTSGPKQFSLDPQDCPELTKIGPTTWQFDSGCGSTPVIINFQDQIDAVKSVAIAGTLLEFVYTNGQNQTVDLCEVLGNCSSKLEVHADCSATFTNLDGSQVTIPAPPRAQFGHDGAGNLCLDDGKGEIYSVDVLQIIKESGRWPSLKRNEDGTYSYNDGCGNTEIISFNAEIPEYTVDGSVITHNNGFGTTVSVDICELIENYCNSGIVINDDGGFTHTDNAGNEVTVPGIDIPDFPDLTNSTVSVNNSEVTHVNGAGVSTTFDICAIVATHCNAGLSINANGDLIFVDNANNTSVIPLPNPDVVDPVDICYSEIKTFECCLADGTPVTLVYSLIRNSLTGQFNAWSQEFILDSGGNQISPTDVECTRSAPDDPVDVEPECMPVPLVIDGVEFRAFWETQDYTYNGVTYSNYLDWYNAISAEYPDCTLAYFDLKAYISFCCPPGTTIPNQIDLTTDGGAQCEESSVAWRVDNSIPSAPNFTTDTYTYSGTTYTTLASLLSAIDANHPNCTVTYNGGTTLTFCCDIGTSAPTSIDLTTTPVMGSECSLAINGEHVFVGPTSDVTGVDGVFCGNQIIGDPNTTSGTGIVLGTSHNGWSTGAGGAYSGEAAFAIEFTVSGCPAGTTSEVCYFGTVGSGHGPVVNMQNSTGTTSTAPNSSSTGSAVVAGSSSWNTGATCPVNGLWADLGVTPYSFCWDLPNGSYTLIVGLLEGSVSWTQPTLGLS